MANRVESLEFHRYFIQDPTAREIVDISLRHQTDIAQAAKKHGEDALAAVPFPKPVSKIKYVMVGAAAGAVAGAAIGAGAGAALGSVIPGAGTAAGATTGAIAGAGAGAIVGGKKGYQKAKKADGINYQRWLRKLPISEARAFKQLFANDPELNDYICKISEEIMRFPASLACHHVYDYAELAASVSRYHRCPGCQQAANKKDIAVRLDVFIRMNQTFCSILRNGLSGRILTRKERIGFDYLVLDLQDRTQDVWERVSKESAERVNEIMNNTSMAIAQKKVAILKEKAQSDQMFDAYVKMLETQERTG